MNENLASLGYRMPAEWEKQSSTWLAWPHNKNDWPDKFENIPSTFAKITSALSKVQNVDILIQSKAVQKNIKKILIKEKTNLNKVNFHIIKTNRVWTRDTGPIFLVNDHLKKKIMANFHFNAWAKYKDYNFDNNIKPQIAKIKDIELIDVKAKIKDKVKDIILEGGAIDVNGKGTLIATKECLLRKVQERNPGLSRKKLEIILSESLNIKNFIWLNKGIVGDDTHGHIDDITRFFEDDKIFTAMEYQKSDENYSALNENLKILKKSRNHLGKQNTIVEIPMPSPLIIDNTRVPASYLNFYIANKIVLLPIFEDKNDDKVFQIFEKYFKNRKIVPINCRDLIWGFGAIHCMTQQEPAI
jgi:agmatine deiminase